MCVTLGMQQYNVKNNANSKRHGLNFYLSIYYSESYKKEVLLPVVKILVKNTEFKDAYENFIDFTQPVVLPPQISELESKSKQVVFSTTTKFS